mmetsp:Transcript_37740/g.49649  ORF Transcript_37740/g.49649 Transcript_37740/m.49649 type:complete len:89 (-) Transcript_37740:794-1060(-)
MLNGRLLSSLLLSSALALTLLSLKDELAEVEPGLGAKLSFFFEWVGQTRVSLFRRQLSVQQACKWLDFDRLDVRRLAALGFVLPGQAA